MIPASTRVPICALDAIPEVELMEDQLKLRRLFLKLGVVTQAALMKNARKQGRDYLNAAEITAADLVWRE